MAAESGGCWYSLIDEFHRTLMTPQSWRQIALTLLIEFLIAVPRGSSTLVVAYPNAMNARVGIHPDFSGRPGATGILVQARQHTCEPDILAVPVAQKWAVEVAVGSRAALSEVRNIGEAFGRREGI